MLDSTSGGSHFYSATYAGKMFLDAKLREQGQSMKDLMLALTPSANASTTYGNYRADEGSNDR